MASSPRRSSGRPELDAPAAVVEVEEGGLALTPARGQTAGHADALRAGLAGLEGLVAALTAAISRRAGKRCGKGSTPAARSACALARRSAISARAALGAGVQSL